MPCPFAPLLSIVPALPLIPWIIGRSMERLGKKNKTKLLPDGLQNISNCPIRIENDQTFSIENLIQSLQTLEYYHLGAPYFRKSKAINILVAREGKGEMLLFSSTEDHQKAQILMELFIKYPISRVLLKSNRLIFKLQEPITIKPKELEELIVNLYYEIKAVI